MRLHALASSEVGFAAVEVVAALRGGILMGLGQEGTLRIESVGDSVDNSAQEVKQRFGSIKCGLGG